MTTPTTPAATSAPPTCQGCLDKGWRMIDGVPVSCSCAAGEAWARARYDGSGQRWGSPNDTVPGGEVLAREAARQAAGLPVGVIDSGAPVRAMLIDDSLVQAALEHVVRLVGELDEDNIEAAAARAFLETLPNAYRVTLPDVRRPATRSRPRGRGGRATPLAPPPPK